MTGIVDLIELRWRLAQLPDAKRRALQIDAAELAAGYHALLARAPRRKSPYLSKNRKGFAPVDASGRRLEERLAMALFNRGDIEIENGGSLKIIDYQFPLKSAHADQGIGKIDLLGLFEDGTLAVVELKVGNSREDRRIGMFEALIYAAVVEANLPAIAKEIREKLGHRVAAERPRILFVAPPEFWTNTKCFPGVGAMMGFVKELDAAVPIEIMLFNLEGGELTEAGLDGSQPAVHQDVGLSPVVASG